MIQIDIEMPKDCEECPLCHRAFDGNETRLSCYGLGAWCLGDEGRLDNCPLHELSNNSPELDKENGELISRKAAIDAVEFGITYAKAINKSTGEVKELFKEGNKALNEAVERLKELPSAQPEPPWIPCSEQLPEGKQEVLVTEYGDTDIGRRFEGRWLDRYGDKMKDVTAWMPKPEPYQGM